LANTRFIVDDFGNLYQGAYAAHICNHLDAHGYNDWYLPAIDELNALWQNRNLLKTFRQGNFWSSTETENQVAAFAVNFPSGYQLIQPKDKAAFFCCIRRADQNIPKQPGNSNTPNLPLSADYPRLRPLEISSNTAGNLRLFSIEMDVEKDIDCGIAITGKCLDHLLCSRKWR